MKTQTWRRINRDDLGDVPEESQAFVDKLLEILNPTLEETSDLAQRGISWIDNHNSAEVVLDLEDDTEVQVTLGLRGKPVRGIVVETPGHYDYLPRLKWKVLEQNRVAFAVKWDTAPTEAKRVRIIFFGA